MHGSVVETGSQVEVDVGGKVSPKGLRIAGRILCVFASLTSVGLSRRASRAFAVSSQGGKGLGMVDLNIWLRFSGLEEKGGGGGRERWEMTFVPV